MNIYIIKYTKNKNEPKSTNEFSGFGFEPGDS